MTKAKNISTALKSSQLGSKLKGQIKKLTQNFKPTENNALSSDVQERLANQTVISELSLAKLVAIFCTYSLLIDFTWLILPKYLTYNIIELGFFMPAYITSLVLSGLALFKNTLLQKLQENNLAILKVVSNKTYLIVLLVVILLVALLVELFLVRNFQILSGLIQICVYGIAIFSVLNKKSLGTPEDLFIRALKRDYFILNSLPLISIRVCSALTIIYLLYLNYNSELVIFLTTGITYLALNSLIPEKANFYTHCKSCGAHIPQRLLETPKCQACQARLK